MIKLLVVFLIFFVTIDAALLKKTGQTISYADYDDGWYQTGAEPNYSRDNVNGIVIDNITGLEWQDNIIGIKKRWMTQANYDANKYFDTSGDTADNYCKNLNLDAGRGSWRLPDIYELETLRNNAENNVSILFKNFTFDTYWSYTKFIDTSYVPSAWYKAFHTEYSDFGKATYLKNVLCVRGKRINVSFSRSNGIVKDKTTGLMWQDNEIVQSTTRNWKEAISYCENDLIINGYNDWRLPNIKELLSIVDYSEPSRGINSIFEFLYAGYTWSSTTAKNNINNALVVDFYKGRSGGYIDKPSSIFVRCVRGGQFDNSSNSNPILTTITPPPSTATIAQQISLEVKAEDSDGDLKQIEVNWDDGSVVTSKQVNNLSSSTMDFSHTYCSSGNYTITSTAYDIDTSVKSNMLSWNVTVNGENTGVPIISNITQENGSDSKIRITFEGCNFPIDKTAVQAMYNYDGVNDTGLWEIEDIYSHVDEQHVVIEVDPSNKPNSTWYFYIFNDVDKSEVKYVITQTAGVFNITSLSSTPNPAHIENEVTFSATLDAELDSSTKAYIVIDGDIRIHPMSCGATQCSYKQVIHQAGDNRKFTCFLERDGVRISEKVGTYTMVSDLAITSIFPRSVTVSDTSNTTVTVLGELAPKLRTSSSADSSPFEKSVTITGEGFSKNSKVFLNRDGTWTELLSGVTYISLTQLQVQIVPSPTNLGKWYFYVKNETIESNRDKFLIVQSDENIAPTLSEHNNNDNPEISTTQSITLTLSATDSNDDVDSIEVNWGDNTSVSHKTTNNGLHVNFNHAYAEYGSYTWSANAYDTFGMASNRVRGTVKVYDPEFLLSPSISSLASITNEAFLYASGSQMLVIKGTNLSRFSKIYFTRADGSGGEVRNDNSCSLGEGRCIVYVSSNELHVNLGFNEDDSGEWRFYIANKNATSNTDVIEIKTTQKPRFISNNISPIYMVSGATYSDVFQADGSNIEKIQMYLGSSLLQSKTVSTSNSATFSYTPPSVTEKKTSTLTFYALDANANRSNPKHIVLTIFPTSQAVEEYINSEAISKLGACGGSTSIKTKNSINTATGAEMFSLPLLSVKGLHNISAVLSYNSLLLTNGVLSKGWSHNYGISANLEFLGSNNIRIHWNDGGYNDFNKTAVNQFTSKDVYTQFDSLRYDSTGVYILERADRTEFVFYPSGTLKEISNYLGQKIEIGFDDFGRLAKVEDTVGQVALYYSYYADGKLSKITDSAFHRSVDFIYDANGQLRSINFEDGRSYNFQYNALGQMTKFINPDGTTHFENTYLANGLIATENDGRSDNQLFTYNFDRSNSGLIKTTYTNGEGDITKFTYDANDFLLYSITDALGKTTFNEYNQTTRKLIKTTNPKGQISRFKYNEKGKIIQQTLPNGLIRNYLYDSKGNLIQESALLSNGTKYTTTFTYNADNTLKSKTLPNGDTFRYEYNTNKQMIKSISPSGYITSYAYFQGRLSKVTYPRGRSIEYYYDRAGRVIKEVAKPINAETLYSYDSADRLLQVTDPMGNSITYTYDLLGHKTSTTDAKGNITRYFYDANGNLLKVRYADLSEERYSYDGEDRVVSITYANGAIERFEYDALGRVLKKIDAKGNSVTFTYDVLGNVLRKYDANGNIIAGYTYNAMQQIVEAVDYFNNKVVHSYNQMGVLEQTTDPLGRVNRFKYDKLSRLNQAIDAMNAISSQSYDTEGNIKDITDPNGNITTFKHDEQSNLIEVLTASGSKIHYVYDANALLIKEINARGDERLYSYNKNAQVTRVSDPDGIITYRYDGNGNLTHISENAKTATMTYDVMNRMSSYTDTDGNTIAYKYDLAGNLIKLIYPDKKEVTYTYDLNSQLISVTDWNGNTTSYIYDTNGRLIRKNLPNGTFSTNTYDNGGRLISHTEMTDDDDTIVSFVYTYDNVGNIISEKSTPQISPQLMANLQMQYTKGNLLLSANKNPAQFDADDNMLKYDTLNLNYDSRNRLIKANNVSYMYDSQNHRIGKTVNAQTTRYVINPNAALSQVLLKTDPNGVKTYYVYGLGLISQSSGTQTHYYHYDLRGSTRALSNATGTITDRFTYAPYGKLISHSGITDTPFQFVAREGVMSEENDLYYMRARYYHTSLRRFVNRDTLVGSIDNFGSLNRFGYVNGRVGNLNDPSGYYGNETGYGTLADGSHNYISNDLYSSNNIDYTSDSAEPVGVSTLVDGMNDIYNEKIVDSLNRCNNGETFQCFNAWLGSFAKVSANCALIIPLTYSYGRKNTRKLISNNITKHKNSNNYIGDMKIYQINQYNLNSNTQGIFKIGDSADIFLQSGDLKRPFKQVNKLNKNDGKNWFIYGLTNEFYGARGTSHLMERTKILTNKLLGECKGNKCSH